MTRSDAPATIETIPLTEDDRLAAAAAAAKFDGMQTLGIILGIGLLLGAAYMGNQGHAVDAAAGVVAAVLILACAIASSFFKRRAGNATSKEVITGVIRRKVTMETRYNIFHRLDIGGVEVVVPKSVFDQIEPGETVQAERLCGANTFIRITRIKQ